MSAYIVDKRVIGYLIGNDMYLENALYYGALRRQHPEETGRMLWDENKKSVRYRYQNQALEELPGAVDEWQEGFRSEDIIRITDKTFDPAQLLKTIAHLDYQSCEHEEWETSEAKAWLDRLRDRAIRALPGYATAKWGAPDVDEEPGEDDVIKPYRVVWEIDVGAKDAVDAARQARQAQEPGSSAVVFRCQTPGCMPVLVDLYTEYVGSNEEEGA